MQRNQKITFSHLKKSPGFSVLDIFGLSNSEKLFDFFEKSISGAGFLVDMHILGAFAEKFKDSTTILPSAINVNRMFNKSADEDFRKQISNNEYHFGGLFDASTWGQYLTGLDPRNYLGVKILYHKQKAHAVNPQNSKITLTNNGGFELTIDGLRTKLFSLHIHSKDRRIFKEHSNAFIQKRLSRKLPNRKYEIDIMAMFTSFSLQKFLKLIRIMLRKI
jgi:hypothetical protein